MRIRIITVMFSIVLAISSSFAKKPDYPQADIKVGYNYHEKFMRGNEDLVERDIPMLLLANSKQSKFYCPDTEYKDSLESTPSGRVMRNKILDEAVKHALETGDQSLVDNHAYKTRMYINKEYADSLVRVYDSYLGVQGVYTEPYSELMWEIGDSTKTVLGYECVMATADYHGRKWTAWFAPEIPVYDGPWKLHGLPGLILEAVESKGHHHFVADGLEESNQIIYPVYGTKKYDRMKRIDMLKTFRHSRDNVNSMTKASIGLDLGDDAPPQTEYDYLETDYRQ